MIGQTISHYKILEKLGEGGMGVVYKAEDTTLGRIVALKLLPHGLATNDAEQARFLQEARAASALNHPNVCTIYRIDEIDASTGGGRQPLIEMEYVSGRTLSSLLKERGALPVKDAVAYAVQIGEALTDAHNQGIVHRDIKSDNIMVNSRNQIKVLDFGLAKLKGSLKLTRTSSTVGTLGYMAPEQIQGGDVDQRSDIFSFGIVLYEMLSGGHLPFRGEHEAAMMYSIVNEEPEQMAKHRQDVPAELTRIVERTLEKDPADRYQHIDDIVSELRRFQKQTARVSRAPLGAAPKPETATASRAQASQTVVTESGRIAPTHGGDAAAETSSGRGAGLRKPAILLGAGLVAGALLIGAYFLFFAPKISITSMAVLPFANVGGDPGTEYLADGFTESLINKLSRLPGVKMMSRSSVFRFKGKDIDPSDAGKQLGVGAVLTGRIVKRGDDLEVSAELVNTQDNSHLWGEQYGKKFADALSIQEDIARQVSGRLNVDLTSAQRQELEKPQTQNSEAYQLCLKGRYYLNKRTTEGFLKAVDYFNQAVEKDPSYALAYAGLADSYSLMGAYYLLPPQEAASKGKAAALKAVQLDDRLAEAHTALAVFYDAYDWNWDEAGKEYRRGIELNPNYATGHQWYGEFLSATGHSEEGVEESRKALELDPLSPVIYFSYAWNLMAANRLPEAADQLRKGHELDPNYPRIFAQFSAYYAVKRQYDSAIYYASRAIQASDSSVEYLSILGFAHGIAQERDKAGVILNSLTERSKHQYIAPINFANVYIGLGDRDRAFEWLEKAYAEHSSALEYIRADPILGMLKDDPRYRDLLKRMQLD